MSKQKRALEVVITPERSALLSFIRELYEFRELLFFLTWKNIKVQFAQTILGFGWLFLRPMLNVLVLSLVFGRIAQIPSDGNPYLLFAFSGTLCWGYFSSVVGKSAMSLVGNAQMVTKIYFPRAYLPISIAISGLAEFFITFVLFIAVAGLGYGVWPGANIWLLPLVVLLLLTTAVGLSLWLSALAIDFRDVRHASAYLIQVLMFLAPVVWPVSLLPDRFGQAGEWVMSCFAYYPLVGIIEGVRFALLGGEQVPWQWLGPGAISAVALLVSGAWYFRTRERLMADLV